MGKRYGRLVVVERMENKTGPAFWRCKCDCGKETISAGRDLRRGTESCGCIRSERAGRLNRSHGKTHSRVYVIWRKMLERCNNPNHVQFHNYGGRGIKVIFNNFEEFYAEMGDPPGNRTIDRIDNDKGYQPGNCQWADNRMQQNNRRDNVKIYHEGQLHTIAEWSRITGLGYNTILGRVNAGTPPFRESNKHIHYKKHVRKGGA